MISSIVRPGSSPLARGLLSIMNSSKITVGIIPARAGFTELDFPAAHERRGSSPLARGLPSGCRRKGLNSGIIPARAGFTDLDLHPTRLGADHPRSRGVYSCGHTLISRTNGSSPLARGLLLWSHTDFPNERIIPARAGFTARPARSRQSQQDHPRSRGVYPILRVPERDQPGSSPLARGLLNV